MRTKPMPKDVKDKEATEKGMIRELAELLVETGLSEIEVERDGLKIRVARQLSITATAPQLIAPAQTGGHSAGQRPEEAAASAAPVAADPASHPGCVKSPMVGTAYRAPEPGAQPFVEVGSRVSQGQTLLIIEAMKTMNHIPAPKGGTVREVFIDNGQPVEYGEALMIIE